MGRCERLEPSRRFLQLPLAADAVPATGLVPRHGDVDEPLEEVALLGGGAPPGVLERLVSGEILAAADQLEALFEQFRFRF